ncbi:MAG: hypothetical protein KDK33_16430, partial [Leptospiraceae bacterium]|nr:hypothetical protein [Leptospiraceae bacterium]
SLGSSVSHHQVQKIWVKYDGKEHPHTVRDRNIDARVGHLVRTVFSPITEYVLYLRNKTLDREWFFRIDILLGGRSVQMRYEDFRPIRSTFSAFFKSLPMYIPWVDIIFIFVFRFLGHLRSLLYLPTLSFRMKWLRQKPGFDVIWPCTRESIIALILCILAGFWVILLWLDWGASRSEDPVPDLVKIIIAPVIAWRNAMSIFAFQGNVLFFTAATANKVWLWFLKGLPGLSLLMANRIGFDYLHAKASKKIREAIVHACSE